MPGDGSKDVAAAAEALALRLPERLAPLARLAYNYWWSWKPEGVGLFRSLDPHRWERSRENPVRLLQEVSAPNLQRAAGDPSFGARAGSLVDALAADLARPATTGVAGDGRPRAFLCAEFGIHGSLPIYAGGLGVLAGDFLKEASDRALPVIGVGLLYSQGSFHQRLDASGWQHEYWLDADPERLPMARVTDESGRTLTVRVPIRGREVLVQIWRVDIGRTPLFLLDSNRTENLPVDRWITARLYPGDRETRLAQYALLGIGSIRALRALGIRPALVHLNEGHAAFAALEMIGEAMAGGLTLAAAIEAARPRIVFTTHTPVAAGNDWFPPEAVRQAVDGIPDQFGIPFDEFLRLGRTRPEDGSEWFGMTPFALRTSGRANGVSRRHGEVARGMWRALWPDRLAADVPIGHVTNGVHLPSWVAPAMQSLLDRHLRPGWRDAAADPSTWAGVDNIPDEELWAVRNELRAALVAYVRERSALDRLGREESTDYAEAAARQWHPDVLTLGFARRIATYKRLSLFSVDPQRGLRVLLGPHPSQFVIAGKAHPRDEEAKRSVQRIFELNELPGVGGRVVFLEDHDLAMAARLVQGCDLWLNLPRPPLEASGTSGMKSALNGGLQLSVLDGWWAEAYDGANGWALPAEEGLSPQEQDARDAAHLMELLEREVLPLFYDRDANGIPRGWLRRVKRSLVTLAPRFTATRMLDDYSRMTIIRYPARRKMG
jgi:starch phosphorylase